MADIGRSTASHATGDTGTHETIARLENWGAWQRALPADGPGMYPKSPMFRDIVDRYRETFAAAPFDTADAEAMEAHTANVLGVRQVLCLQMRFILQLSSRKAADLLSRQGYTCSHTTYRTWVDDAIMDLSKIEC